MTELSFAKVFLSTLDQRPSKISSTHIEDPRTYPAQNAYILPRMPKPLSTRPFTTTNSSPSQKTCTVHLTSTRNPPLSHTLSSLPLTTSIHEMKSSLSSSASIPIDKLKILWNKRPVADSKILKDFVSSEDGSDDGGQWRLEFGVMVMGGAASVMPRAVEGKGDVEMGDAVPVLSATETAGSKNVQIAAPVAQGVSGVEVIESKEFWGDLEGFLMQRVRDEDKSKKLLLVFKQAFEDHKATF